MKIEINNENKVKFFAQYWGQRIVTLPNDDINEAYEVSYFILDRTFENANYTLNLTPLSELSDEDSKQLFLILTQRLSIGYEDIHFKMVINQVPEIHVGLYKDSDYSYTFRIEHNQIYLTGYKSTSIREQYGVTKQIQVYDFLRSKGYALPWMGLSVEDMIEAEWIKLS